MLYAITVLVKQCPTFVQVIVSSVFCLFLKVMIVPLPVYPLS